ncbi:MAG: HTTM domain-containing protein, partial [Bacteroidia bacterium]|nr:HTTM domain-containing protein [Bacteroidia bacterium]
MMLGGVTRFMLKGWVADLYVKPAFYFTYYGFEWVKPLGETGMHTLFFLMGFAALMMSLGFLYRFSAIAFFLSFTYVELIDKSNYLNHYYFVSIIAFLMILLPAGNYFSIDTLIRPAKKATHVPRWCILIIQFQLGIVYFFAGISKLNPDWLLRAQPLRTWLPPHTNLPVIGYFMDKLWIAYFFSWFGAVYDLCIPFMLCFKKTRKLAYFLVLVFHILTAMLFQIGMFPYVMIVCTLIFFPEAFHLKIIGRIKKLVQHVSKK